MTVDVRPLPAPLSWDVAPASWRLDTGPELVIAAPARCDLFRDPGGREPETGAPRLLGPAAGDFQLFSARAVHVRRGAFDAGALLLWAGRRHMGEAGVRGSNT